MPNTIDTSFIQTTLTWTEATGGTVSVLNWTSTPNSAFVNDTLCQNIVDLGFEELTSNSAALEVYPNPSNGEFTIDLSENITEAVQVELISLVGNVVFSDVHDTGVKGNSIEINTESIESGSYLVRITGSDSKNSTTTSISIK